MAEFNASKAPASNCSDNDGWSLETSSEAEMSVENSSTGFSCSSAEAINTSENSDDIENDESESDESESDESESDESESDSSESDSSESVVELEGKEAVGWESFLIGGTALEPLYEGADVSIFDSHLLLFEFAIRHSLTKKAFSELIDLVATHLPRVAKPPASVYKLKQLFLHIFPDTASVTHKYCSKCHHTCLEIMIQFVKIAVKPK